jgi:hypothetical protein
MQTTIQIQVSTSGCRVTVGGQTERFTDMAQVVEFTRQRLEAAARLQDLCCRCE